MPRPLGSESHINTGSTTQSVGVMLFRCRRVGASKAKYGIDLAEVRGPEANSLVRLRGFVLEWQPKLLFTTSSLVTAFTVAHRACEKVACSVLESQISGRHLVDAEGFGFDDLSK